jgi:phosphoadenosine phosphosulfate reductase
MPPPLPENLVRELNQRFETAEPQAILRWALEESDLERIAIASAFQAEGTCVMHMAVQVRSDIPVLFLETGFHFAETLGFKERLTEQLGLNVVDVVGDYTEDTQADAFGPRLYERDPTLCCQLNKVTPFNRVLRGMDAWITSMRRDSAWTRTRAPIIDQYEHEPGLTLVKVNPIANWTKRTVWAYLREHGIPHNPLYDLGYASIGCAPCTRMVFPGEDERAGRWSGQMKTECGIHVGETHEQDGAAGQLPAAEDEDEVPLYSTSSANRST